MTTHDFEWIALDEASGVRGGQGRIIPEHGPLIDFYAPEWYCSHSYPEGRDCPSCDSSSPIDPFNTDIDDWNEDYWR